VVLAVSPVTAVVTVWALPDPMVADGDVEPNELVVPYSK
jgi:hypothetical protein